MYPWIILSTAMVNHYYVYLVDGDFGPLFIKFCSYFPYTAKLCLNGHEWLKRQLTQRDVPFEPLDNGIRSCDAGRPRAAHRRHARRRQDRGGLPQVVASTAASVHRRDRAAGYRYEVSMLQAEFSLTQVLDRPVTGRFFFEEVIRENLDLGRPDSDAIDLQPSHHRSHAGPLSHPRVDRGRRPVAAHAVQEAKVKQYHKEARPFAPKPPSTTPTTSPLVVRSAICPPCGRSAFPPTDACCTSNHLATTA